VPRRADEPFVSRAGRKLDHALEQFAFDVAGMRCADFGCNVGGFTDCLLQRGAASVHAVDTGYGVLDYRLRTDDRVTVMERTNALHAPVPAPPFDLVTIDLAWTPQRRAIPVALDWLLPAGTIILLVKPHYELTEEEKRTLLVDGCLDPEEAERVLARVVAEMPAWGATPTASTRSPITGGKSTRKGRGNVEYLVLAVPAEAKGA